MKQPTNIKTFKRRKHYVIIISDLKKVSIIIKRFYGELKPYFKYRLVFSLAKNLLDFREQIVYTTQDYKQKIEELD